MNYDYYFMYWLQQGQRQWLTISDMFFLIKEMVGMELSLGLTGRKCCRPRFIIPPFSQYMMKTTIQTRLDCTRGHKFRKTLLVFPVS